MSAAAAPLLYDAGARYCTRSASGIVASAVRGFQIFRVDGYSWTTMVASGDRITTREFGVGGQSSFIDYYPNGADVSKEHTDSLHLRLNGGIRCDSCRVRAHYKFSLLDLAGNAAYELPALESTFTYAGRTVTYASRHGQVEHETYQAHFPEGSACGYREFITREELERRREVLLKDDCLAIRCDIGVLQLYTVSVTPKKDKITKKHESDDSDCEDSGESRRRRRPQPMDDSEYIRRCLAKTSARE